MQACRDEWLSNEIYFYLSDKGDSCEVGKYVENKV